MPLVKTALFNFFVTANRELSLLNPRRLLGGVSHSPHLPSPKLAALRARMAAPRNTFYRRTEKLRALLFSRSARKILFSEKLDWADEIKGGFRRLPHQIDFGSITEESFRRYDIVVPLTLPALQAARRLSPYRRSPLPLPTEESMRLCDDKYEFNRALIMAGFGQYIPQVAQGLALTPPYILKKRIGWWGSGCYIIRDANDERAHLDLITDPKYFCQQLILGTAEFATHILFSRGKIVKALNIKYEFATDAPIKGQNDPLLRVVHRCSHLNLFADVLRAIQFEGLCCVNYKVAQGRPYLLEINPRFGGSLSPYFFSFVRHLR